MNLSPDVVAKWVEAREKSLVFKPLREVIADVLSVQLRGTTSRVISDEEISETAESLVKPVATALGEIREDYISQGIDPSFEVDFNDYYFKAKDSPELTLLKDLRAMTPSGFEHFCKIILDKMGGTSSVQGGSQDQGVDFYALDLSIAQGANPMPRSSKLVVIGQAKRWTGGSEVSETELRKFVGGALLQADRLRKNHTERFGLMSPVCLAYWVTCDFNSTARRYAQDIGIWYLNGKGLAQLAIRIGLSSADLIAAEKASLIPKRP